MNLQCEVTFEFEIRPPMTWKGFIEANAIHTICHRAVSEASKDLSPRNWTSMACLVVRPGGGEESS